MTATKAREGLSTWISKVQYAGQWVLLMRHGKAVAAMVSVGDLELLRELEDAADLDAVRDALKEKGKGRPWSEVKKDLGI